jgi:hypothetical protein
MYTAKRFSCGPGAERRDPTKQVYTKMFFYDPVVLGRWPLRCERPVLFSGVALRGNDVLAKFQ